MILEKYQNNIKNYSKRHLKDIEKDPIFDVFCF